MAADASIDFYFDPTCGWAWRTSIWMRRIARVRSLSIGWRPYSLAVVNSPDDYRKGNPGHVLGVPLLRTLARRTAGNDAVDRLYVAYGNVYHARSRTSSHSSTSSSATAHAVAHKQPFVYELKRNRTRASQYAPNQYAD